MPTCGGQEVPLRMCNQVYPNPLSFNWRYMLMVLPVFNSQPKGNGQTFELTD